MSLRPAVPIKSPLSLYPRQSRITNHESRPGNSLSDPLANVDSKRLTKMLSPLESAFTSHVQLIENTATLSPLESTFMRFAAVTPLEATFTKKAGVGGHVPWNAILPNGVTPGVCTPIFLGRGLFQFCFAVAVLGGFEKAIEGGAVKIFSAEPDGADLRCVVNVREGIGGEQHEVSALSGRDRTKFSGAAEEFRGAQRGGLQGGKGSEARFDEQGQLVMQAETRHAVRVHGVGAGKQRDTGAKHDSHHLLICLEELPV